MPNTYLSVTDLVNAGIAEWKAREAIRRINSEIRKSGGLIGSRDSAPRAELETLFRCTFPTKEEA